MVVNVLQAEFFVFEVNYIIRQGCYVICLQFVRFFLCGQIVFMDIDEVYVGNEELKIVLNLQLVLFFVNILFNKYFVGSYVVQVCLKVILYFKI